MEIGSKQDARAAEKIVSKLSLGPGEVVVYVGTCSNWTPIALDHIVVTNSRLIGTPAMGVKAAWEAPLAGVTTIVGDAGARTLSVTTPTGRPMVFKKVPAEDHDTIVRSVQAVGGASAEYADQGVLFSGPIEDRSNWERGISSTYNIAGGQRLPETTMTIFRDGTFKIFRDKVLGSGVTENESDRLLAIKFDSDSIRRKSTTGRVAGFTAATLATGGANLMAHTFFPESTIPRNNRGVIYLTVTGERTGVQTYSTKNPSNRLLESLRQLEVAGNAVLAQQPKPVEAAMASASPSAIEQLRQLADLHRDGVLSDDEFAAAKAKLLGTL